MRFDPRLWNLIPVAAVLAGCQPSADIPIAETGTDTGDGDGDPTTTGDGDGDPATTTTGDGDGDPTTTGDGDGDPTTTGDGDGDGDGEYAYPDCFGYNSGDAQCELGNICEPDSGTCAPLEPLADCEPPALLEIPLAEAAQGTILDLSFADLDADGTDELLVLQPGLLVIVDGGASSSVAVDPLIDGVVAVHVDGDAHLDVLASSTTADRSAVLLGVGDGSLLAPSVRTLPGIGRPLAIDWTDTAGGEVAAVTTSANAIYIEGLTNVAPTTQPFPLPLNFPQIEDAFEIHAGDFDGDGVGDVLIQDRSDGNDDNCGFFAASPSDGYLFASHLPTRWNDAYSCHAIGVPRTGDPAWAFVFSVEYGTTIELRMIEGLLEFPWAKHVGGGILSGTLSDLARVDGLGLILATASGTKLVEVSDAGFGCLATLAGPPASARVVVGNFADNQGDEFATVDEAGVLQIWGLAP